MSAGAAGVGGSRRVLVLGPLRPPHISDQVLALAERGFELHVAGNAPPGHDNSVIEGAGVPVTVMPDFKRSTPWGMRSMVRWLRALVARVDPAVVQAHWIPGYGLAAAIEGSRPLALTAWGSDVYGARFAQRLANRYALARAGVVMADSQDLLDRCIELGAASQDSHVVQWGVDTSLFRPADEAKKRALRAELGLGPGPVILSPRSFYPVYNIDIIADAFARIGEEFPDAQLVLKHMGTVRIDLGEIPHRERVKIIEKVPYERMADYYRAADVCLSVTSSDSSPRSVWEAMAAGNACVLTELAWVDELVRPAAAAELVAVRDVEATAGAVISLLRDPASAAELGRRGRALVERELDREQHMDRLAALLEEVGG